MTLFPASLTLELSSEQMERGTFFRESNIQLAFKDHSKIPPGDPNIGNRHTPGNDAYGDLCLFPRKCFSRRNSEYLTTHSLFCRVQLLCVSTGAWACDVRGGAWTWEYVKVRGTWERVEVRGRVQSVGVRGGAWACGSAEGKERNPRGSPLECRRLVSDAHVPLLRNGALRGES